MDIRRRVGIHIRAYREMRRWSQEDLGFEAGLHRTYISGVERGVRNPTVLVLGEIAKALGVPPGAALESKSRQSAGRKRA